MFLFKPTLIIKRTVLTLCFILLCNIGFSQGPTDCGCDDKEDPGTPAWFACLAACDDADVPVNGNVWVLAVAGLVLFAAKEKLFKNS